jgi:hypothetical protein
MEREDSFSPGFFLLSQSRHVESIALMTKCGSEKSYNILGKQKFITMEYSSKKGVFI